MTSNKILLTVWPHFQKILKYHGLEFTPTYSNPGIWGGDQQKFAGYEKYNFLADINLCFSTRPSGLLRDRTGTIDFPFLTESSGPWMIPTQNPSLEDCFQARIKYIESKYPIVNFLYSGGIDSTAMVVSWLKYSTGISKARILYSIDSIKENPEFFLHLRTIPSIELVEIGGRTFYENDLDGVEIHGGGGDDLTASMDESFFEQNPWWKLQSSWKDWFWEKTANQKFIDFCEEWFASSGRNIDTLLEARWWFYLNKMSPPGPSYIVTKTYQKSESFYCDDLFVAYFYHNIDSLFASAAWRSYKQDLKNFSYDYYPDSNYRDNKCKTNSGGYNIFLRKMILLKKEERICILSDGSIIKTDNLPFLSQHEYRQKYGNQLDYLFKQ